MKKYNEVSVRPHPAPGTVIPKKGGLMSKFNERAGSVLNKAFGAAEVTAGWGMLGVGTLGAVALMFVAPVAGFIALPTAIIIGAKLAEDGLERASGLKGGKGGPRVSNKAFRGGGGGGGGGSKFVPEQAMPKQEWYDKAPAQEQPQDPGPFNPTQPGSGNNPFPMYGGPKL